MEGPPAPPADATWARATTLAIWDRLASRDCAGRDPYDALNARFLPSLVKNARVFRRALTQAVKRSPLPLQPLLGVPRQADAYTLGHVLLAAARLHGAAGAAAAAGAGARAAARVVATAASGAAAGAGAAAAADLRAAAERVVARLRAMASVDEDQIAWGYHFPVHTRFFSYVPPMPNLIVTAFVAKGMIAATRAGLVDCLPDIRGAVAFILRGLPRVTDETGQCIGYVPGETTAVHNANMLAALVLAEAAGLVAGGATSAALPTGAAAAGAATPGAAAAAAAWLDEALACARYTAARQATDGSWPYSEESYGRWIDGFHTGFVLEGLAAVVRATGDVALRAALDRGVRFYVAQLFGPGGEPKYYPHKARPFDALSAAQGVETLYVALASGAAPGSGSSAPAASGPAALMPGAAHAVPGQLAWIREHLVRSGGRVAYQVHCGWTDRREFPRWSSAPLMSALAGVGTDAAATVGPATVGGAA